MNTHEAPIIPRRPSYRVLRDPDYMFTPYSWRPSAGIGWIDGARATVRKEWAYAGLVFDLTGAFYSHLSVGDPPSVLVLPAIGLVLVQRPRRAQGAPMNPVIRFERGAARVVRWEPR
jgi:hypothetical protein